MLDYQFDGLAQHHEDIAASYRELGIEPPERVAKPARIRPEFDFYWRALMDLSGMRPDGEHPIPVAAMLDYAARFNVRRVDEYLDILAAVDRHVLEWLRRRDNDRSNSSSRTPAGQLPVRRGADPQ